MKIIIIITILTNQYLPSSLHTVTPHIPSWLRCSYEAISAAAWPRGSRPRVLAVLGGPSGAAAPSATAPSQNIEEAVGKAPWR